MATQLTTILVKALATSGMLGCGKSTATTGMLALVDLPLAMLTRTCNAQLMSTSGEATPGSSGPLAEHAVLAALIKFSRLLINRYPST